MLVGIDLGTTNSLIALWTNGQVRLIQNSLGKLLTPSVISVDESTDTILIGEPALNRLVTHPELTVANFKRYMGTNHVFKLGKYSFRPEELSSLILKRLKEDAENHLKEEITDAVISVPAYFSDAQRKSTQIAGKLAGLKIERLINEPTAAGIAYSLQEQDQETNFLVFDLGGGTFDVSVLTMFSGIIEVRASNGDNLLGGLDFTKIITQMFHQHLHDRYKIDSKLSAILQQKIYNQAELAKHKLSLVEEACMKINIASKAIEFKFTAKNFEESAEPLLQRLKDPVRKVLIDAKLSASQINQVVLVGGASRMLMVRKLVSRMFGKLPLIHLNPDTVVAQGAAIQAGFKSQDKALDDFVVTDVSPYTLGIAVYKDTHDGGVLSFDPLIERNSTIPVSRSRSYRPVRPDQRHIDIEIFQGESFFLEKNVFLGKLSLDLPINCSYPEISVRFTYDINGILEVEATIVDTQEKKTLVIQGNPGVMTEQELKQRLDEMQKLKIHPREETENATLLTLADKLYADLKGDRREYLAKAIQDFISVLNTQELVTIAKARIEFKKLLDELTKYLGL